jgi:hypothetical protein
MLQGIMGARFEEFLDEKHTRYFVDFVEPIGAAYKLPTSYVCFEIDYSTPSCHAYPVSIGEVQKATDTVLELIHSDREPYTRPIRAGDVRIVDPQRNTGM